MSMANIVSAVENLQPGMTIGMLSGVVKVVDVEEGLNETKVFVSIGRLKRHKVGFKPGTMVEVLTVPADLAAWYGV